MNVNDLYAELVAPDSPAAHDALQAVAFNDKPLLSLTNPERLLGLTPKEVVALVAYNGACDGSTHALQALANQSGGGWGEILRSSHMLSWFQWLAYNTDNAPAELVALARITQQARAALDAEHHERRVKIQHERNYGEQTASARRTDQVHKAQTALLETWAGQHTMTLAQMYGELSRLSNKLNAFKDGDPALTRHELEQKMLADEPPHSRKYLRGMTEADTAYRVSNDSVQAFYCLDRADNDAHHNRRLNELQEALLQFLLTCETTLPKAPTLDSLVFDD